MVAFIRRTRSVMFVTGILAAFLFVFADTRFTGPAIATSGGDPYVVPLVTDTNPSPTIVETTITAQGAVLDIGGGLMANVLTFNGTIPGPEFRLNVGDTVIVHFKNNLGHASGIHWHGIELANASDGTPLTQNMVPPGESFLYKFKVTRPGVYWYHPHHHSSTNQVFKGLYGSLIVTDPNEAALQASGTLPSAADTRTLVLSDITVCKAPTTNDSETFSDTQPWLDGTEGTLPAQPGPPPMPDDICELSPVDENGADRGPYAAGDVPNIQPAGGSGPVSEGQTVLTNGMNVGGRAGSPSAPGALAAGAHTLDVQAGQGVRLQLINTATTRFFRLKMTDAAGAAIPLVRVGGQGGLLDIARTEGGIVSGFDFRYGSGEILIDPGDRADVVIAIPPAAVGPLTLWTKDFERTGPSGRFTGLPTVPVAHFNVTGVAASTYTIVPGTTQLRAATGDPQITLGAPTGTLLDPTTFAPPKPGMALQDIQLTNSGGSHLGVNDIQGEHDAGEPYSTALHPLSTRYAKLGDILELTVTNGTGAHHPFHLHGFSIQPIDLTKSGSPTYTFGYSEYRDNIDVPGGYTLKFRVKLDDRFLMDGATLGGGLGRWVFHCHIFFHASFGMISEFDVVAPDGNERPYVNSDETEVQGAASDTLAMDGTFSDPDGDAVTLTASTGDITDNGDGTWSWSGSAASSQLVYVTATDATGLKDQVAFQLKINQPPVVTVANASGNEGSAIAVHGTATDPEGDPLTQTWTYSIVSGVDAGATCSFANATLLDTTVTCTDDGSYKITLTVSDGVNAPVVKNGTLTVANVAPTVTIISPLTGALYLVNSTVTVTAGVADPGSNDTQTCTFNWDGGGVTSMAVPVAGTCSKSNLFSAAGVYTVTVSATDDDGGVGSASLLIVVYDPDAGFVTGGGTINSAAGAYRPDVTLSGQAQFGFYSKYLKGASIPTGQTQFTFQAGSFNFHATVYEWLVVSGPKAQYKGSGQVNGSGDYAFLLTVTDGQVTGGGGFDKFRLKVVEKATNTVIYDNAFGSPEDMDVANPQVIASGSIVIHKGKN